MEDNGHTSRWMGESGSMSKGLDSLSDGVEDDDSFEVVDDDDDDDDGVQYEEDDLQIKKVDSMEDILSMDLKGLSPHLARKVDFARLELAYQFYNEYGKANGFSIRKGKIMYNNKQVILQRDFVCHRQGYKEDRGLKNEIRKRAPKPETRCGCEAKFRVHIYIHTERWYIACFTDKHNYELLDGKYYGMLHAHRKMPESDIMQMNVMLQKMCDIEVE